MQVAIDERWERYVENAIKTGAYASADDVVREGLRLVEERDRRLTALRTMLDASIAEGGHATDDELGRELDENAEEVAKVGI
jgi:antitoxin ParD1/3/4